jgi:uncharacterized membrane protein
MLALSRPRLGAARPGPTHGIWIAVTTFVPTFLALVFGLPYLAGRPMATPTRDSLRTPAVPATPPAIPRPAARPTTRPIELKTAEPQRSAPTVTQDDTWARGPAFASRDSAEHFAARMQRVGFPAHVRREDRRGTRWVVWIGNPD